MLSLIGKALSIMNLPQNDQTINKEYYLNVLRRLREAIRKKRPILWRSNSWMLHHDNAPAHRSSLVSDFLKKHGTVTAPQPPYSSDHLCFLN